MTPQPQNARPNWTKYLPPLLAFVVVALLALLLLRPAPSSGESSSLLGKPAPDFTLRALDGQTVSLSQLRGQPVVLNFWASWCGPCKEEAPLLHELSAKQGAQGFKMIGLLFQETSEQNARKFIAEHGLNYPNIQTPNADTGVAYGIAGIPDTVFIDKNGVVQHLDRGGLTRERLNVGLEKIGLPKL